MDGMEIELKQIARSAVLPRGGETVRRRNRINLLSVPWLRRILVGRWALFLARAITLAGFVFTILVGLVGSPVGSHNFAIIFVWIAWWTALKLVFIPLGGRSWCSVCPIPVPGEWIQQGGLLGRMTSRGGLGRRWPKRLQGYGLQAGAFLLIGLFSALTLTDPKVTALVLLGLFGLSIALSLAFERRAFCEHLCPIGGFTGLYSQAAPVELRVIDSQVCKDHQEKTCYQECPWGVYPLALKNNADCGLCLECVRVCPHDNLALNLRPFGADLFAVRAGKPNDQPARKADEAFLALVMLGSALAFAAVYSGPWGWLKAAAFDIGSAQWLAFALSFLALAAGALPGLYAAAVVLGGGRSSSWKGFKQRLGENATLLLPLGLFAWIAFTVSFALPKLSYVLIVLSDPLGQGWNLLGAAWPLWNPGTAAFSPILQVVLLMAGLFLAVKTAARGQNRRMTTSLSLFALGFSLAMLWLLIG